MRFMVIVKASKESESGALPDGQALAAMAKFNEKLVEAGVMLAGEGLHASKDGVRIRFTDGSHTIVHGPFPHREELVAGYWLWKADSLREAAEWLKRAPFGDGTEVEIRQVHEAADFAPSDPTGAIRKQEDALRKLTTSRRG